MVAQCFLKKRIVGVEIYGLLTGRDGLFHAAALRQGLRKIGVSQWLLRIEFECVLEIPDRLLCIAVAKGIPAQHHLHYRMIRIGLF